MAKIERKFMAHFIETGEGTLVRLGKDLEEYAPELSAQVEKSRNILGQTNVIISGYEKTAKVEPYYAEEGDPLFARLQEIIDGNLTMEALKTNVVEVKLWQPNGDNNSYPAIQEEAYIEVSGYGGDTSGYQIPFTLHYTGEKVAGSFDITTKTFTPAQ